MYSLYSEDRPFAPLPHSSENFAYLINVLPEICRIIPWRKFVFDDYKLEYIEAVEILIRNLNARCPLPMPITMTHYCLKINMLIFFVMTEIRFCVFLVRGIAKYFYLGIILSWGPFHLIFCTTVCKISKRSNKNLV